MMLCPWPCQGLMDTAQQSQDRAGTGISPGRRTQLISLLPQALPPWQDRGVCPQSPPVPKDSKGATTVMSERENNSWGG